MQCWPAAEGEARAAEPLRSVFSRRQGYCDGRPEAMVQPPAHLLRGTPAIAAFAGAGLSLVFSLLGFTVPAKVTPDQ
jgi:hypothetical protein